MGNSSCSCGGGDCNTLKQIADRAAYYARIAQAATAGSTGATGADGATGATGLTGATGEGATGATGLVGATGELGATGATGLGATGATGEVGATGETGPIGLTGATGEGATGATGEVGATGDIGLTGATGDVGPLGATGATGDPGPPLTPRGAVNTYTELPETGNIVGDLYHVLDTDDVYGWDGSVWVNLGPFPAGPQGATGASGIDGLDGATGATGPGVVATRLSNSTNTINLGTKTFTYGAANVAWSISTRIRIAASPTNWVEGYVFSVGAGTVTVVVDTISGSGTFSIWNISLATETGATGATGATGETGATGTGITILGSYPDYATFIAAHPTGNAGDGYLVGGDLYVWDADNSVWVNVGNIQGPQGATGPEGATGATGATGEIGATGASGSPGGATGAGTDAIFFLNDQTVNTSYTIPTGQNAGSFGPITIASGVTVTVPTGGIWTVV